MATYNDTQSGNKFQTKGYGEMFRYGETVYFRTPQGLVGMNLRDVGQQVVNNYWRSKGIDPEAQVEPGNPTKYKDLYEGPGGRYKIDHSGAMGGYGKIGLESFSGQTGTKPAEISDKDFAYLSDALNQEFGGNWQSKAQRVDNVGDFMSAYQAAPKTGGDITKSASSVNPQGSDVMVDGKVVSKALPLGQVLANAGATPEQQKKLEEYSKNNPGKPYPPELLKGIGLGPAEAKAIQQAATAATSGAGTQTSTGGTGTGVLDPVTGKAFQGSTFYNSLSPDLKALVDLAFSTFNGTPEEQQVFADALKRAADLADPYSKSQLTLALGDFESKIAFAKGDLERASEIITRTRDQLLQDVSAAKEFLTLEQQAEVSNITESYNEDLLSIGDQAADKGLTFATGYRSRQGAEKLRGDQYADVIESSRRQHNFKIREQELLAARGDVEAQKRLEDMKAKSSFELESIGRNAERVLGTAKVNETGIATGAGYTPAGGTLGDVEQERRQAIIGYAGTAIPK